MNQQEAVTKLLAQILQEKNPGKLPDEAEHEARAVMMYFPEIMESVARFMSQGL